ncbi:efflux transporter outer membrane subunit [Burkholderia cenocepacia]|uniref:efflux transporter outer membrane subunit n=1 Tax=Burkholderia cenocepacia TaxID=95486 RepID=UPI00098201BC|nr:RND transporter [Burkholderia cenocepacia]
MDALTCVESDHYRICRTPTSWTREARSARLAPPSPLPTGGWWRAYGDTQLNRLIDTALAHNPSLSAAHDRVRVAQAMARAAHANELPKVDGSLRLLRQHWPDDAYYGPGALGNSNTWNNTGGMNLAWHIDLWGRDKNIASSARDRFRAREADELAARLQLQTNIVYAYIDLALNIALLANEQANTELQQKTVELVRKRLKAGIATQLELSEAESPLPGYVKRITAWKAAVELNQHQLAALIGEGPGAGTTIQRPQIVFEKPIGLPSTLPSELVGRRPDVIAARWEVESRARGVDVARAAFYPNIDLLASIGSFGAAAGFIDFLRAANGGWSAGPALTLPIFEGGRLRARLAAATAEYDEAVDRYNRAIIEAIKDIADNVVRVRSLATQMDADRRSISVAARSLDLARISQRRGLVNYKNVLVAQANLLQAQNSAIRTEVDLLKAHAALMASLGGSDPTPRRANTDASR